MPRPGQATRDQRAKTAQRRLLTAALLHMQNLMGPDERCRSRHPAARADTEFAFQQALEASVRTFARLADLDLDTANRDILSISAQLALLRHEAPWPARPGIYEDAADAIVAHFLDEERPDRALVAATQTAYSAFAVLARASVAPGDTSALTAAHMAHDRYVRLWATWAKRHIVLVAP